MNNKENLLEKFKNALGSNSSEISPERLEEVEKLKNETEKLNSNIDFYKATVKGCDALINTVKLMEERGNLSSTHLADILAATILMFEREGLIKIIRKKENK